METKRNPSLANEHEIFPGEITFDYIHHLIGRPDPVLVEIGANNGSHTAIFLNNFPWCEMHAFEPDPRAQQKFVQNGLAKDPRVRFYNFAIGNQDGTAEFYMSSGQPPNFNDNQKKYYHDGWDLSGSIRPPTEELNEEFPWLEFKDKMTVRVRKLDSWAKAKDIGTIDFIWADVQGAEIDLIEGGKETLSRTRYFYTEYSNKEFYKGQIALDTLCDMLPDFTIERLYAGDVLLRNTKLS